MSQFILTVKQIDLLSQKPTLLINNSDRAKSLFGAILTFLLACFIIIYTIVNLIKLFARKEPDFNNQVLFRSDLNEMGIFEFPFFFVYDGNPSDIDITLNFYSKGVNNKIDLKNCNNDVRKYIDNAYCIDNLNMMKDDMIYIYVRCRNNCLGNFIYGYYDILFDIHNSESPVIKSLNNKSIMLNNSTKHILEYSVKSGKFQSDNGYVFLDIVSWNILFYEIENSYSLQNTDSGMVQVNIRPNMDVNKIYKRSYYKGQVFFAELGGIFNFVYILAYNLNLIHSIIHLNLTIDKECKISSLIEKVTHSNLGNRF
jgi:hypothetical protein